MVGLMLDGNQKDELGTSCMQSLHDWSRLAREARLSSELFKRLSLFLFLFFGVNLSDIVSLFVRARLYASASLHIPF